MPKIYLAGMILEDFDSRSRAETLLTHVNPDVIGIEETQSDIDSLMYKADVGLAARQLYFDWFTRFPNANRSTAQKITEAMNGFYSLLHNWKKKVPVIGFDDPEFDSTPHQAGIEEYKRRVKEFHRLLAHSAPEKAELIIESEYSNPHSFTNSPELAKYAAARDKDTAQRLSQQKGTVVYFGHVNHFYDDYHGNLFYSLYDIMAPFFPTRIKLNEVNHGVSTKKSA